MKDKFSTSVRIKSEPATIWNALTSPEIMSNWLGEPEMNIEVLTDWKINSPILIRGFHHTKFANKGFILQYDKGKKLVYSHLSSVSRLPDLSENYTILEFNLIPIDRQTQLSLNIENFPTETIRQHLEFYWKTTIVLLKKTIEKQIDK